MIEWTPTPHSSNIAAVGFDPEAGEMVVRFTSGAEYAYSGVGRQVAADLGSDPSPGGYFARYVKNRYTARKLT